MAHVAQFGKRRTKLVDIDSNLKALIDRVIAPILVQNYLAGLQNGKGIAERTSSMASFEPTTSPQQSEVSL
jgi:hypothetical protein